MAYSVKLKNQSGTDVNYNAIEQVTIPLASGTGYAIFTARYGVSKTISRGISYVGGDTASNGVDYMCRITATGGAKVPNDVTIKIGDVEVEEALVYSYTKLTDTEAIVKINGTYITGLVTITAEAV